MDSNYMQNANKENNTDLVDFYINKDTNKAMGESKIKFE